MTDFTQELGHGVTAIDTGFVRPGLAACYLVTEGGRAAYIDTGTARAVPRLLEVLAGKGLAAADVDYVIVTHVHLDHAGGAGALMAALPNAKLVVHPFGAAHMIDPTRLIEGATAVYGEQAMGELYGEILAVVAERVIEAPDDHRLALAGRELRFLDTPGHARHHFCIHDEQSQGIFTGDTFGLSYPDFATSQGAFVFPTTTPVQFDPAALHASVDRLLALEPACMYLTHYGRVDQPERAAGQLHYLIDEHVALARRFAEAEDLREVLVGGLAALLLESLREHGCTLSEERSLRLMAMDLELNAQGLEVWLRREGLLP